MKCSFHARRRAGISELVGTVLAISITVIAGAAVWGYVRNQAGNSENAVAQSALTNNNFLGEHFSIGTLYFASTTTATFWLYNTGSVPTQVFAVRMFGPSGTINLLFNYTAGTDNVYDLASAQAGKCKTPSSSYESPLLSTTIVKRTNAQYFTLTLPAAHAGCPSYGTPLVTGNTYDVQVTGQYGNTVTFSQTM